MQVRFHGRDGQVQFSKQRIGDFLSAANFDRTPPEFLACGVWFASRHSTWIIWRMLAEVCQFHGHSLDAYIIILTARSTQNAA
jgi:hypothetical protein